MTNNELVHCDNKGQSSIFKIMLDILDFFWGGVKIKGIISAALHLNKKGLLIYLFYIC